MAVGLEVVEKNLEDLEKEITCAICQEHHRSQDSPLPALLLQAMYPKAGP